MCPYVNFDAGSDGAIGFLKYLLVQKLYWKNRIFRAFSSPLFSKIGLKIIRGKILKELVKADPMLQSDLR